MKSVVCYDVTLPSHITFYRKSSRTLQRSRQEELGGAEREEITAAAFERKAGELPQSDKEILTETAKQALLPNQGGLTGSTLHCVQVECG
ncbi:unnamed protein product [Boreogadus saida]